MIEPLDTVVDRERAQLRAKCDAVEDERLRDNVRYFGLFNRETGIFHDHYEKAQWEKTDDGWKRRTRRLRRRAWIETYFPIRDVDGVIVKLKLNPAQRRFEAWVLRMMRAGMPVRLIFLKARQMGISTYVQAITFERVLRGKHIRALIVADKGDHAQILLNIAKLARTEMNKSGEERWQFKMTSKAADANKWDDPFFGEIVITSAQEDAAGRSGTRNIVHTSEAAYYPHDVDYAGILGSLPSRPETFGFEESTANGDRGKFRDGFWDSYRERDVPLRKRKYPWVALFLAWWEHPGYFWTKTYGAGRELTQDIIERIQDSISKEEQWLLNQKYLRRWTPEDEWEEVPVDEVWNIEVVGDGKDARIKKNTHIVCPPGKTFFSTDARPVAATKWRRKGVGWQPVSFDQLAWRRAKIDDKDFGGDLDKFDQDYPSRPEVAFKASGRPVFDQGKIDAMIALLPSRPAIFRGALRSEAG